MYYPFLYPQPLTRKLISWLRRRRQLFYSLKVLQVALGMTIRATKFTPEVLLSAPRRSPGIPNSDGSKILYSVSTYSFAEHSKSTEIRILDVESQQTSLVTDNASASAPNWLGDDTVVLFSTGDDGVTSVKIGGADNFSSRCVQCLACNSSVCSTLICILTETQQLHRRHHRRPGFRCQDSRSR